MTKSLIVTLLSIFFLLSCVKKEKEEIFVELTEEEKIILIYEDAVDALKKGDAFYAGKKFTEVEILMPQSKWAAKSSLMTAYSDYSRNSYESSVFNLERHIKKYPADENIPYAHYLIAICYYEQILDEKKDLDPLRKAKNKFEFILSTFPDTDYATDASFKLELIEDQLAAKEMSLVSKFI